MGRAPCCDKAKVKRGPWSPEEDATLKNFIHTHGSPGNWIALPHKAGLKRCGKSCRLRWLNYLRPNIKHGGFTEDEDYTICSLYSNIGSRWSVIASQLPGRTDNDVKNHWNTKLKKKILAPNHNSPINHFPFSNSAYDNQKQHTIDPQVLFLDQFPILSNYPIPATFNQDWNANSEESNSNFPASCSSWPGNGDDDFLMALCSESPKNFVKFSGPVLEDGLSFLR